MKKRISPRQKAVLKILFDHLQVGTGWVTIADIRNALQHAEDSENVGEKPVVITDNNVIRIVSALRHFYKDKEIIQTYSFGDAKRYTLEPEHIITRNDTARIVIELMKHTSRTRSIDQETFYKQLLAVPAFKKSRIAKATLEKRVTWLIKELYIKANPQQMLSLGERSITEFLYINAIDKEDLDDAQMITTDFRTRTGTA